MLCRLPVGMNSPNLNTARALRRRQSFARQSHRRELLRAAGMNQTANGRSIVAFSGNVRALTGKR